MEKLNAIESADAVVTRGHAEKCEAVGVYTMECHDKDGNLKWSEVFDNLVTTAGKNELLEVGIRAQTATATWYLGLISSTAYSAVAAADTMASHAGWVEAAATNVPDYDEAARPTCVWSAASAGAIALSSALVFTINESGTVKGCFITDTATKDGATGTLYSAGLFTGGDKVVIATDVISVSYTTSL
tara:strand:+ start:3423 stop:3983 length:561 start_codon:yes stop_codon:yes gene_type:complete